MLLNVIMYQPGKLETEFLFNMLCQQNYNVPFELALWLVLGCNGNFKKWAAIVEL